MRGDELRALREAAGLSQAELASLLGVAPNTVARRERDERPISREAALAAEHVCSHRAPAPTNRQRGAERIPRRGYRNGNPHHRMHSGVGRGA